MTDQHRNRPLEVQELHRWNEAARARIGAELTLATEVKSANPIGAETAPVLDVAISAAVSSVPRVSPVFKGGPSQLGSGVRKAAP